MGLKEYLFGKSSEDKACKYLIKLGYEIIERNFRCKFGEIDIIALDPNNEISFVEVKSTSGDYEVIYRLTNKKYEKILKTINYYLLMNNMVLDYRIDLLLFKDNKFELIKNISII